MSRGILVAAGCGIAHFLPDFAVICRGNCLISLVVGGGQLNFETRHRPYIFFSDCLFNQVLRLSLHLRYLFNYLGLWLGPLLCRLIRQTQGHEDPQDREDLCQPLHSCVLIREGRHV